MSVSSSHVRAPLRRAARFVPVACWGALIYLASDTPDLRVSDDDLIDLVLRKLAHLFVFGVFAVLVARAIRPMAPRAVWTCVAAWTTTLVWAISDEWHQSFVTGRVGHASDVAIDMTGATAALLAWHLQGRRTSRRNEGSIR